MVRPGSWVAVPTSALLWVVTEVPFTDGVILCDVYRICRDERLVMFREKEAITIENVMSIVREDKRAERYLKWADVLNFTAWTFLSCR